MFPKVEFMILVNAACISVALHDDGIQTPNKYSKNTFVVVGKLSKFANP